MWLVWRELKRHWKKQSFSPSSFPTFLQVQLFRFFMLVCMPSWLKMLDLTKWFTFRPQLHKIFLTLLALKEKGLHGEASYFSALQEQESPIWLRLWPLKPTTPHSSPSLPLTWCPSGLERVKSERQNHVEGWRCLGEGVEMVPWIWDRAVGYPLKVSQL